ncbi:HTH-type transcriptional repressor ComR [Kordia sp. SMS9]|uniref:TetR/AcrR family transcriptional regulator n=1 Tax=Kordia sp. SMS9 TaxID=2282170 RepID=UPI000E0D78D9|nr:TetR/AcrR family transcriptional regulator [Kordia sp. SMS9]AXG70386.1 HTH-type transcriptional repressor ComR [Kordia sp. SMS9]
MPRVKNFNEEETLNKAMCLFWRNGFYATSMQDLVNHLGINRASIYDTYGGKKELFDKAFAHYRATNRQQLQAFLESQESVKKGFRALFESGISEAVCDAERKGCFVINVATELVPNDTEMLNVIKENKAFMIATFEDFLKKGVDSGEILATKNIQNLASLLHTFFNGIKVVSKTDANEEALLASVDTVLTLLD